MNDDRIYEVIGAIANVEVDNDGTKLKLNELANILTILDIESNECDHYTARPDGLIRQAHGYFNKKGDTKTADNIKQTFIKKDGNPVIP
jgi:hypothetical protein